MNEYDSPNYAEYVYDRKNEGKLKLAKTLAKCGYALFALTVFAVLCANNLFWYVALLPIFTWMLVYFTWGLINYDFYYEFKHGVMEFGRVRSTKNGRRRIPKLTVFVKDASLAKQYAQGEEAEVEVVYDYSESQSSENRIIMYFEKDGKKCAVIFEGTARVAKLIASFCSGGASLKGLTLHG